MMSSFSKAIVLAAVLLGSWACLEKNYLCEDDSMCPPHSFCFKEGNASLCIWGEWTQDTSGAWAVLPEIELSSGYRMETDSENPKLQRLQSSSRIISLNIYATSAASVSEPFGDERVVVECDETFFGRYHIQRSCTLSVLQDGEHLIQIAAENANGINQHMVLWKVGP
jgi:hypothetical protein